uniref:Uncharacterized protein n=1 Tax=Rangifer tarandus platyrhynchus TaxID=3082113 RepID=A0ACB0F6B4_RANTA|nr:unnamed protein product [Rangifer tarandus platyrhynchus]
MERKSAVLRLDIPESTSAALHAPLRVCPEVRPAWLLPRREFSRPPHPSSLSCIACTDSCPHQKHIHTEAQESLQRCRKTTLKCYGEMLLKFGLCSPVLNRNGHRVSGEVEENSFIALPGKRGPGSLVAWTEWPALEGAVSKGQGGKSKAAGFVLAIQAALGAAPETEGFWLAANSSFKVLLQKGNALPLTDGSPVLGGGSQQGPPALTCVLGVADKFPAVERQLLSGFLSFPQSCSFTCSFAPSEICPLLCTTTSSVRSGQASD